MIYICGCVCAKLQSLQSKDYVKTLSDREHLTEEAVDNFANHYLKDIANGSVKEGDWVDISSMPGPNWGMPFETYAVSKVAVTAFVSVLHNTFFSQPGSGKKINIFSCCPGYVSTSVNTSGGKSVEVGADTPVWLALHSPEGGSGKFWAEREVIDF
jgi:NAD(P)-dependent dehydrogenase (short-subunit alcohol dehydrogenase family)